LGAWASVAIEIDGDPFVIEDADGDTGVFRSLDLPSPDDERVSGAGAGIAPREGDRGGAVELDRGELRPGGGVLTTLPFRGDDGDDFGDCVPVSRGDDVLVMVLVDDESAVASDDAFRLSDGEPTDDIERVVTFVVVVTVVTAKAAVAASSAAAATTRAAADAVRFTIDCSKRVSWVRKLGFGLTSGRTPRRNL